MKLALHQVYSPWWILIWGCGSPTYQPYEGEAYPNRRPALEVPAEGVGLVTDSRSDTLSVIDLVTGDRMAYYPAGRDPVTIDGPHHLAVDAEGRAVYITLTYPVIAGTRGPHTSHGLTTQPGYVQKLSLDDLRVLGQVRIDNNPGDIVMSVDGHRLVTSHFDLQRPLDHPTDLAAARAPLAVMNPAEIAASGSPAPTFIRVCVAPYGLALSGVAGDTALVACYGEDVVAVVDLDHPDVEILRVPVGPAPTAINPTYGPYATALTPDGSILAVSLLLSREVIFYSVADGVVSATRVHTPGIPYALAWTPDGRQLYIATQSPDAVLVYDLEEEEILPTSRDFDPGECDAPRGIHVSADLDLFVVCEGDQLNPGTVLMLDGQTLETAGSTEVGVYPDAFAQVVGGDP